LNLRPPGYETSVARWDNAGIRIVSLSRVT
jgi:hypothetical protein